MALEGWVRNPFDRKEGSLFRQSSALDSKRGLKRIRADGSNPLVVRIALSAVDDIRLGFLSSQVQQPLLVVWLQLEDGRSVMMAERRKGALRLYWQLWNAWRQHRVRSGHRFERPPLIISRLTRNKHEQGSDPTDSR